MEIGSSSGVTCQDKIRDMPGSCSGSFQTTKECDKECNLCACSTLDSINGLVVPFTTPEHCSGHGYCHADCDEAKCDNARCKCNEDYGGRQCELGNHAFHIIIIMHESYQLYELKYIS